jgi:serine protease inhibitor
MKLIEYYLIFAGFIIPRLLRCVNHEEHTRNISPHLNNATSTFLYNAIPSGTHAEISAEYNMAINTFSVNLPKAVYANSDYLEANVTLSPFSVSRNLAVIAEASSGESKQQLLNALGGQKALDAVELHWQSFSMPTTRWFSSAPMRSG